MLISEKVKLKWNSRIHKHYVDLGYKYTKMGDEFDVNVNDLTHGSRAIVKCICDYCGNEYSLEWQSYYRLKQKQIVVVIKNAQLKNLKNLYNCYMMYAIQEN